MKTYLAGRLLVAGALVAAPLVLFAQSEDERTEAVSFAAPAGAGANDSAKPVSAGDEQMKTPGSGQTSASALSAGIEEILKMVNARVSPDVIKAYVESASVACNPTATDIVALKAHGVSDDITTALLKRSAEGRAQLSQRDADTATRPNPSPAVKSSAAAYARSYALDPESYEYFQYYYLHPRTLASVYQRLSPYYPRSYGYNPPLPYGPYFPGRHSHLHRGGFPPPHGSRW